jgi:hypothetical protein
LFIALCSADWMGPQTVSVEHGVVMGIEAFAVPNTQVLKAYLRLSITFSQNFNIRERFDSLVNLQRNHITSFSVEVEVELFCKQLRHFSNFWPTAVLW